ncbi:MAG TPA: DUF3052 domain-containing protein [Terriglobales bacterium]|jgi:hypothetical protein|nr:DUF3052 domain-containing protein [Terriglobales bacterium]
MAGYSGTPLLKKLGIKEGDRVLFLNSPRKLPDELRDFVDSKSKPPVDFVLLFATSMAEYQAEFARAAKMVVPDGMVWVAWPKKASGIRTDLTENVIRDHALKTKFVDVKVCAIDDMWSGLKLVVRKELRAKA